MLLRMLDHRYILRRVRNRQHRVYLPVQEERQVKTNIVKTLLILAVLFTVGCAVTTIHNWLQDSRTLRQAQHCYYTEHVWDGAGRCIGCGVLEPDLKAATRRQRPEPEPAPEPEETGAVLDTILKAAALEALLK